MSYFLMPICNDAGTRPGYLTRHTTSSKQFYKAIYSAHLKTPSLSDLKSTFDIKPMLCTKLTPHVTSSVLYF